MCAKRRLTVDTGLEEIWVNDTGVIRFSPGDPNLYSRFFEMRKKLLEIEKKYEKLEAAAPEDLDEKGFPRGEDAALAGAERYVNALRDIDAEVKAELARVFGPQNDFDSILGGVNLMAVGRNGERVVTNLLQALAPIMAESARKQADAKADAAVEAADANRETRRAAAKRAGR